MTTGAHSTTPPALPGASPPAPRTAGGAGRRVVRAALSEYSVLLLAAIYFLVLLPFRPDLAGPDNLLLLLASLLPLLAVTLGELCVLITGGIDLSVSSVIAMSSVVGAWVMNDRTGWLAGNALAVPAGIAAMLVVGAAVGAFNGAAVTLLEMPPFIVTLATMMGVSGAAVWATKSRNIGDLPEAFLNVSAGSVGGVPAALFWVAGMGVAVHLLLARLLLGRWLYAVGLNARAARVSGVPVRRTVLAAYVLSGLCAGAAAVLYTGRLETASPTLGREILLDVIGAAVIGGTSLFGGKGKVLWVVFGVLLFTLISNSLSLFGLAHFTVMAVKGGVILLAALLDLARTRYLARS